MTKQIAKHAAVIACVMCRVCLYEQSKNWEWEDQEEVQVNRKTDKQGP